jgi:ABC-type Na+ transport system ATPase subunit NatA
MSVITIRDLTRDYNVATAAFQVSFTVKEGEAFGFRGNARENHHEPPSDGFLKPQSGHCEISAWLLEKRAEISKR